MFYAFFILFFMRVKSFTALLCKVYLKIISRNRQADIHIEKTLLKTKNTQKQKKVKKRGSSSIVGCIDPMDFSWIPAKPCERHLPIDYI